MPEPPERTAEAEKSLEGGTQTGRHTAIGAFQNLSARAVALITGFATIVFLTRRLGPELYGQYSVAFGIVLWIELVAASLLSSTTVRLVAEADDWKAISSTLAQIQVVVSLGAAAVLIVMAPTVAAALGSPGLGGYLRLFALEIPLFGLNQVHRSTLIGQGAFGRGAIVTIVYWLSRIVLMLLLVGCGLSVMGAILANLGAAAAQLMMSRVYVQPALFRRVKTGIQLRGVADYALPLTADSMGSLVVTKGDLLIVRAFAALPGAAGFYSAAADLATVPVSYLVGSFTSLLLATLTHLWEDGQGPSAQSMANQALRLVLCLLPFAALAAGSAPGIVTFVYGEAYLPAGPLFALLIFAAVGSMLISVLTQALVARGQPRLILTVTLPRAVLALAGYLVLTPRFGPIGAAASRATLTGLAAMVFFGIVSRRCGVQLFPMTVFRTGVTAAAAYAASRAWQTSGWLVIVELLVVAVGVVACLFLVGELTQRDVQFAVSLLRSKPRGSSLFVEGES